MNHSEVVVAAIRLESDGVLSFELRSADKSALPVFTAGAHIEVQMSPHLARSYSLANDPEEAKVLYASYFAHERDNLIALRFEGLQIIAIDFNGEFAFDAANRLFDVVGDGL